MYVYWLTVIIYLSYSWTMVGPEAPSCTMGRSGHGQMSSGNRVGQGESR